MIAALVLSVIVGGAILAVTSGAAQWAAWPVALVVFVVSALAFTKRTA